MRLANATILPPRLRLLLLLRVVALLLRHTKSTRVTRLLYPLLAGVLVLGVLARGALAVLLMPLYACGAKLTSVRTCSLPTVAERLFYWDASNGVTTRAVYVSSLGGASDVPIIANKAFVSDIFRFAFCFGANDQGTSVLDPMLIRWSDQEDVANWTTLRLLTKQVVCASPEVVR
jgi:hypothetical protein